MINDDLVLGWEAYCNSKISIRNGNLWKKRKHLNEFRGVLSWIMTFESDLKIKMHLWKSNVTKMHLIHCQDVSFYQLKRSLVVILSVPLPPEIDSNHEVSVPEASVVIRFQVKGRNCHWRSVLELMLVLLLDDSLSKQNFRLYAFSRRSYSFRLMMSYEWVFLVVSFPQNNRILPV